MAWYKGKEILCRIQGLHARAEAYFGGDYRRRAISKVGTTGMWTVPSLSHPGPAQELPVTMAGFLRAGFLVGILSSHCHRTPVLWEKNPSKALKIAPEHGHLSAVTFVRWEGLPGRGRTDREQAQVSDQALGPRFRYSRGDGAGSGGEAGGVGSLHRVTIRL